MYIKTINGKNKTVDTYRTRTCAGEPKRFLVFRLNHSAKVSVYKDCSLFYNIMQISMAPPQQHPALRFLLRPGNVHFQQGHVRRKRHFYSTVSQIC